jgi:RNA polymerase sigma-70 factor (ECF subfamily)
MLKSVSSSLLSSPEDAEECVNDTYLDAWNAMPTERPTYLGAFLAKIVRRISVDRFRHDHRQKRGGIENLSEELSECIPDTSSVEKEYENGRLAKALNAFLLSLDTEKRVMFIRRYFYSQTVARIALEMQISESNVKVTLHRVRERLRRFLQKEDLL